MGSGTSPRLMKTREMPSLPQELRERGDRAEHPLGMETRQPQQHGPTLHAGPCPALLLCCSVSQGGLTAPAPLRLSQKPGDPSPREGMGLET